MVLRCVFVVGVVASLSLAAGPPVPGALSPHPREWPCPISAQILPCQCSLNTDYRLYMDCSKVRSDEELEKIFSVVYPFIDFYEIKIIHDPDDMQNTIDQITPNTFGELTFERIIITGTRLTDINDEAFSKSHNTLNYLDLSNNQLSNFPFESLALYTKLHTFIIDDNKFPKLYDIDSPSLEVFSANRNPNMVMDSSTLFSKAVSLREIYFSEIGLKVLQTDLFAKLKNLERVDFSKNHLKRLEENSVSVEEGKISYINFERNEISFVRHDAFHGLTTDAVLRMAHNEIEILDEESWKPVLTQITTPETIDLADNNLLCGCEIDWLFMQHDQRFLCRFTDTTLCTTGEQLIFLDTILYCDRCADSFLECPPETDCKLP